LVGQEQKIGLVLSGGGATGLCHIGVLKALEENNIPIDYIAGTSAGAMIASMYACGYSPEQIETYVLSNEFQLMTGGDVRPDQHFLLHETEPNGSMISLSFSKDSILRKSLPTNFNSSSYLDFEMMKNMGLVSASKNNDFDSLFIPFRCVASDIAKKESVVFKDGHLNAAVRASMTFPFFIKPIRVDGVLLFDGGLYNNFPADVMYNDFNPDFIIGSNVSYNAAPPDEKSLISQLTNMLVAKTDFSLPCEQGIIIEPDTDVSTFSFVDVEQAIEDGYKATLAKIDSIKVQMTRSVTKEELSIKRHAFRSTIKPLNITSISTKTDTTELSYTRLSLIKSKKPDSLTIDQLEKRYFRLYATPQVDFIFPVIENNVDGTHNLSLKVRKANEFKVDVGGHISSRPVNTGYLGLSYQTIKKLITKTHVESYFGKFYGSAKADFTIEFPAVYPISIESYFTLNRWDYFRSFATFFEDVHPSFLVQNEMYGGIQVNLPFGNTIKSSIDARLFGLEDSYYLTETFEITDTADVTRFEGFSASWKFLQNSLNRKQFASSGHYIEFKARYIYGEELSTPGSTSFQNFEVRRNHSWVNLGLTYQSFVLDKDHFHIGLHGQAVFNSQSFFANYTATLLAMNEFSLVPDAKTFFLPEYRAPQFLAGGINVVSTLRKNLDVRIDAYFFQPIIRIIQSNDGSLIFSDYFDGETLMASGSIIFHTFLGPLRASLNFFPQQVNPISFQFSFGYVLFNERAIR
jgi:NTE family protein